MDIKLAIEDKEIGISLYNSLFTDMFKISNREKAIGFVNLVENLVKKLQLMCEVNLSELNDEEFYDFISQNYTFDLSINDYINIYNIANKKKYNYYTNFKTNMFDEFPKMYGCEIYNGWCLQPALISYKVLLSNEVVYDYNNKYSINEIDDMINNNDLILIEREFSFLSDEVIDYEVSQVKDFKTYSFNCCKKKDSPYFKFYISFLREKFTKDRIKKDFKQILIIIQKELDKLLKDMYFIDEQQKIITYVNKLLSDSNEYKIYQKKIESIK